MVLARIADMDNSIPAEWSLLTHVISADIEKPQIAIWYYDRWRIENYFKLLNSQARRTDYWQPE